MKPCSNTKHSSHPIGTITTHPTGWNPKRPAGRVGRIHRQLAFQKLLPCGRNVNKHVGAPTVDGRNPAPPGMYKTLQLMGFLAYQLVQDFFHQQYVYNYAPEKNDMERTINDGLGRCFGSSSKCAQAQVVLGGLSYKRNTPISICPMYIYIL